MAKSNVEVTREMTQLLIQVRDLGESIGFAPEGLDEAIEDTDFAHYLNLRTEREIGQIHEEGPLDKPLSYGDGDVY